MKRQRIKRIEIRQEYEKGEADGLRGWKVRETGRTPEKRIDESMYNAMILSRNYRERHEK